MRCDRTGDARFFVSSTCPKKLPPQGQCHFVVAFKASGAGTAVGRLVIAHNADAGQSVVPLRAAVEVKPPVKPAPPAHGPAPPKDAVKPSKAVDAAKLKAQSTVKPATGDVIR